MISTSSPIFAPNIAAPTGDSFEIGGGYSLHPDLTSAEAFKPKQSWFQKVEAPKHAYVSLATLEELMQLEDKTIFKTWER